MILSFEERLENARNAMPEWTRLYKWDGMDPIPHLDGRDFLGDPNEIREAMRWIYRAACTEIDALRGEEKSAA